MNSLLRTIGNLAALAFAFFALTGASQAAQPAKLYKITTLPSQLYSGTQNVTFTMSSTGNSSISSFKLYITNPPAGLTINSGSSPRQVTPPTTTNSSSVAAITFNKISTPAGSSSGGDSFEVTINVTIPSQCATFVWEALVKTGDSLSGQTFSPDFVPYPVPTEILNPIVGQCDGVLKCPTSASDSCLDPGGECYFAKTDPSGQSTSGVRWNDKNSLSCSDAGVSYAVRHYAVQRLMELVYDYATAPSAVLQHATSFLPERVALGAPYDAYQAGLPKPTLVAWQKDGSGNWIWKTGQMCLSPYAPTNYGTLGAYTSTGSGTGTVPINTTGAGTPLPAAPFFMVVGTERMVVTSVAGASSPYTLTVKRTAPANGTVAIADGTFSGRLGFSTPLPEDSSGVQMNICLISTTATADDGCDPWTPPSGWPTGMPAPACVKVDIEAYDIGDGAYSRGIN